MSGRRGRPDDVRQARAAEVLGPLGLLAPAGLVGGRLAAVLHERAAVGATALPAALVALAAVAVAALVVCTGRERVASVLVVVAMPLVVLAGVLLRLDTAAAGPIADLVDRGGRAAFEALVGAEPRPGERGWQTVLRVTSVDGVATRARAVAFLDEPLVLGERLELAASAGPLPTGGYGRWLAQAHAVAVLDVHTLRRVGTPGPISGASEWVRERIRSAATRHLDVARGGLLVGFVTGDTRLLPEEDVTAMRTTGLSHLTAVSGSNTAVLLGGVAGVLLLLRIDARWRRVLLALTVVGFAFLTRLEPSVLRAGTMALLVLATSATGLVRDARHLLAGAVVLLVLVDPLLSWSLGLLLSAGATLGVLVLAPLIAERAERVLPRRIAALVGITLGAQLAVAPVLLLGFGGVPWVSVPANLVAVPVAAVGASLAFLGSAAALVHPGVASSVFALAGPAAGAVLRVARVGVAVSEGALLPASASGRAAVAGALLACGIALVRAARRRDDPQPSPATSAASSANSQNAV